MRYFSEQNIYIFLIQLFLLLGLARVLGEVFRRWKQPALTAEILVGILLGPTILGRYLPPAYNFIFPQDAVQINMLDTVTWLGLLFFLLEIGLKVDFTSAWKHRGKALKIAVTDIIVPMALGLACSFLLPDRYLVDPGQRLLFAFFMATVMTISAMPITIRALADLNLIKTDLGYLIMSALSVNEIIGWIIFTLILGSFTHISGQAEKLFTSLVMVTSFTFLCLSVGRRLTDAAIRKIKEYSMPEPGASLTFLCLLGFLCGAVFQMIGMHALLGFFIAGIMAGEAKALSERTRQVISQMVYAIFVPLFFAGIGLKVDFFANFNIILVLFVTLVGIFAKFSGAWLGARLAGLSRESRMPVAIAHIPGGSMEIVIGIVALRYGFISESVFVAIVFGGIVSAAILGPWLKFSIVNRKKTSALEFFSKSDIIPELKAHDRDSAINELCVLASGAQGSADADKLFSQVQQREKMMGTALEDGVAVPHARLNLLPRPVIVFGRSARGIDWNSPDGKLTQFVFLILTPKKDDDSQIQILRIISRMMQDKTNRESLARADDAAAIWEIFLEILAPQHVLKNKASG
ncbi:MAG: cation:proton antiporter [Candidatus Omnitrophota bacterium]|nr:cation:proton antiporter [Candidatus Omnitrophota bacterium]